jgi:hypothetical protein
MAGGSMVWWVECGFQNGAVARGFNLIRAVKLRKCGQEFRKWLWLNDFLETALVRTSPAVVPLPNLISACSKIHPPAMF